MLQLYVTLQKISFMITLFDTERKHKYHYILLLDYFLLSWHIEHLATFTITRMEWDRFNHENCMEINTLHKFIRKQIHSQSVWSSFQFVLACICSSIWHGDKRVLNRDCWQDKLNILGELDGNIRLFVFQVESQWWGKKYLNICKHFASL